MIYSSYVCQAKITKTEIGKIRMSPSQRNAEHRYPRHIMPPSQWSTVPVLNLLNSRRGRKDSNMPNTDVALVGILKQQIFGEEPSCHGCSI